MAAGVFLLLGGVFGLLLFEGHATGRIRARGWGFGVRVYQRDDEPLMFWLTFWLYAAIVVVCAVLGLLLALRRAG
ncbi:MAG TPA: hypothetical protein PKA18_12405 [Ottowia sp.]|jgi:hypothetical protein|nr:hypothetical protein [Ottowia sp.]HMT84263.1 hypothetical protein [Ottowia sp.]HOK11971.1 hypothetical protein [Ottowia sp.]HPP98344.1 hypothetical protein [Ottowia sp.]